MKTYNPFVTAFPILILISTWIPINMNGQHSNFYYYRTYDGIYNDLRNPKEGRAGIPFLREAEMAQYDDDGYTMMERPNPRMISNTLLHQEESIPSESNLSSLVFTFLQFVDHDITATSEGHTEYVPISVPAGDPFFDPFYTGRVQIPFLRSAYLSGTGTGSNNPRQQMNTITAWLDGSVVYGSDRERALWLRSRQNGKLKVSASAMGDLLPCNTTTGDCDDPVDPSAPFMANDRDRSGNLLKVFVAGDIRANEQPGLTSLHTIFVREHNRICDELVAKGSYNDERNYQYARKMVGGIIQSILYNELLPLMGIQVGSNNYRKTASPEILNSFATAAFRLGHTMVTDDIMMITDDCGEPYKSLSLAESFFNPRLLQTYPISDMLRGLHAQTQEKIDVKLVNGIRSFLFGLPGAGGLDLGALNIQRGRDHGIPSYVELRKLYNMAPIIGFSDITSDRAVQKALRDAYGNVENIDPWVGLLAEDHVPGKVVGELLHKMLEFQFQEIKEADRFYFTRDQVLSHQDKTAIAKTSLSDVIKRNSMVEEMTNAFITAQCTQEEELAYCKSNAQSSKFEWIESVSLNGVKFNSGNNGGYASFMHKPVRVNSRGQMNFLAQSGHRDRPYREHWNIWVDFNGDGIFGSSELVYSADNLVYAHGAVKFPANMTPGKIGMRIVMSYYDQSDPCGKPRYGEVEDYMLEIGKSFLASSRSVENQLVADERASMSIYPNPAAYYTEIEVQSQIEDEPLLTIFNATGAIVSQTSWSLSPGRNVMKIDTDQMTEGHYFVRLTGKDSILSSALIVQR